MILKTDIIIPSGPKYATPEENIQAGLQDCLKDKINEGIKLIASQGGFIENPLNRTFKFDDESKSSDISFLCYTDAYYQPCVVQESMIIQKSENELKKYIESDVRICFNEQTKKLQSSGYTVDANYGEGFDVEISPGKAKILMTGIIRLTQNGQSKTYDKLTFSQETKLYDLAFVAQQILSQEAEFCNFMVVGYQLTYPDNYIRKFRTSDGVAIYRIENKDSGEIFKLATKGCLSRPGI